MKELRREWLKTLLNGPRFNGDRAAFCKYAEISNSRLTQLLDPDEPFGDVAARKLCDKLGLQDDYFTRAIATVNITAPGGYVTATASNQAPSLMGRAGRAMEIVDIDNHPDYAPVRRVNIKAQAGVSGFSIEYLLNDEKPPIFFRRDWYRAKGFAPDRMIAVRVTGESMIPTLYPDDLIVVNTAQTQPQHSKTFLVSYEGEIVVKRLVRDDGQWWLTSDNADQRRYPRVRCNGETEIIGEVVYRQTEVI